MNAHKDFLAAFPAALLGAILFFTGLALQHRFGPLTAFVAPAPFFWMSARHGTAAGVAAAFLATAALLQLVPSPSPALSFLAGNALPAVLYGTLLRRGFGHVTTALLSASAAIGLAVLFSALQFLLLDLDVTVFLRYQYGDLLREVQFSIEGVTGVPGTAETAAFMAFLAKALPSVLFMTIFMQFSFNALAVVYAPLPGKSLPVPRPALASLALPDGIVWVFIPSLAGLLFAGPPLRTVALNITVVLVYLYLLQGLSIVVHFMNRLKMSRPVRMLFLIAALLQPYILLLPVIAGLLDFRFDFRRPRPTGET